METYQINNDIASVARTLIQAYIEENGSKISDKACESIEKKIGSELVKALHKNEQTRKSVLYPLLISYINNDDIEVTKKLCGVLKTDVVKMFKSETQDQVAEIQETMEKFF